MTDITAKAIAQHTAWKRQFPAAIGLFLIGDFYETFGADAPVVAKICKVALSESTGHHRAGFPAVHADQYLRRILKAGHRVIIGEISP